MFKDNFKKMVLKKDFKNTDFEIIQDSQASSIIGGCNALVQCGTFTGACGDLQRCNKFTEKSKLMEESL